MEVGRFLGVGCKSVSLDGGFCVSNINRNQKRVRTILRIHFGICLVTIL